MLQPDQHSSVTIYLLPIHPPEGTTPATGATGIEIPCDFETLRLLHRTLLSRYISSLIRCKPSGIGSVAGVAAVAPCEGGLGSEPAPSVIAACRTTRSWSGRKKTGPTAASARQAPLAGAMSAASQSSPSPSHSRPVECQRCTPPGSATLTQSSLPEKTSLTALPCRLRRDLILPGNRPVGGQSR